jgi:ABC-type Zn2+ transport system substrate-binding protein/surface adhesin
MDMFKFAGDHDGDDHRWDDRHGHDHHGHDHRWHDHGFGARLNPPLFLDPTTGAVLRRAPAGSNSPSSS